LFSDFPLGKEYSLSTLGFDGLVVIVQEASTIIIITCSWSFIAQGMYDK